MTDEEYVRSKWKEIAVTRGPFMSINITPSTEDGVGLNYSNRSYYEDNIWSQAADFTRARVKQIEEITQEITYTKIDINEVEHNCGVEDCGCNDPHVRILARLESIKAELQRGMK